MFSNYLQTSGSPQIIGSGGIGYIHNNGDYGYGIYVSSPGGIDYNGTDLLQTHADSGTPGYIYLDGGTTGNVSLAGTISADKSDGAGAIGIFAPQITTNGITLSASAASAQPVGSVGLFTNQVINTGGLTISTNGDGGSAGEIHSGITPVGSWSIAVPASTDGYIQYGDYQAVSQPVSVTGAGALTFTANGDNNAIQIYGLPLNLSSSTINITQQGQGDGLYLFSSDLQNNYGQLTLGGNVQIHENTKGQGSTANILDIRGTSLAGLTGHVTLDTSGIDGGDGADFTLPFDSGSLTLGAAGNSMEMHADGSSTGGKGGTITAGYGGSLTVKTTTGDVITASAVGGDGDGGTINVQVASIASTDGVTAFMSANGFGNGDGGTINVTASADADVDVLSANAGCSGTKAGDITLTANNAGIAGGAANGDTCAAPAVKANSLSPKVDVANIDGGTYTINSTIDLNVKLKEGMNLDGQGSGKGGTLVIHTGNDVDLSALTVGKFTALGGSNGGLGGTIWVDKLAKTPANYLITELLDVRGAETLSESQLNGTLVINGVTCTKRNLKDYDGRGKRFEYWNCKNGSLYGSTLNALSDPTKDALYNIKAELFVFDSAADANSFFGANPIRVIPGDGILGFARTPAAQDGSPLAPEFYTVVYLNGNSRVEATIRHEIGHEVDFNYEILSQSDYMNDLVQDDFAYLRSLQQPCAIFPDVCHGGVVKSDYANLDNVQILQKLQPIVFLPSGARWLEMWAELYAMRAGSGGYPAADGFLQLYFPCTTLFLNSMYDHGGAPATYPGTCPISHPLPQ